MADVTNIELFGTKYNIKDIVARNNISSLQNTVNTHTNSINDLRNDVDILPQKITKSSLTEGKIICIGDSYADGWTPSVVNQGWCQRLATALNKNFGNEVKKYAVGGCGFCNFANNHRFSDLLLEAINDTSFNNNDVSLVIFGGGYNDAYYDYSANEVNTRVSECANLVKQYMPNAKMLIVYMANAQAPDSLTYDKLYRMAHRWLDAGGFYGISSLYCGSVLKACSNDGTGMAEDGRHPDNYGQYLIGTSIANFINGGNVNGGITLLGNLTGEHKLWGLSDSNTVTLVQFATKDYQGMPSNFVCNGANVAIERDLSSIGIKPNLGTYFYMNGKMIITTHNGNETKYYLTDAYVHYNYSGLQRWFPIAMEDDHSNFLSLTGVTTMSILPHTFTFSRTMV